MFVAVSRRTPKRLVGLPTCTIIQNNNTSIGIINPNTNQSSNVVNNDYYTTLQTQVRQIHTTTKHQFNNSNINYSSGVVDHEKILPNNKNNKNVVKLPEFFEKEGNKIFGTFSGQGFEWYLELKLICTHFPQIVPFVEYCCDHLEAFFKENEKTKGYRFNFQYGFRVLEWIKDERLLPDASYLGSAQISMPMITLTQMASVLAICERCNMNITKFREFFSGFTGHSQGLITAIIVSLADSDDFLRYATLEMLKLITLVGVHTQQNLPFTVCPQSIRTESINLGYGEPTCMLLIQGIYESELNKHILELNEKYENECDHLSISLMNTSTSMVASGSTVRLHNLRLLLDKYYITDDSASSSAADTLYLNRKKSIRCMYVPATIPFHSVHGKKLYPSILNKVNEQHLSIPKPNQLKIPVYSCVDALNIQSLDDMTDYIVEMLVADPVRWDFVCHKLASMNPTHIIDFGPGNSSSLLVQNTRGTAIEIIQFNNRKIEDLDWFTVANREKLINWVDDFYPRSIHKHQFEINTGKDSNNEVIWKEVEKLDTKFTRVYKQPPILVAGMTPSTAHASVVAAVTNAGYYAELAGGGLPTKDIFENEIKQLASSIAKGQSIHVNIIMLNAALWNFQFKSCIELRRQGYPIESIVCAAGVPSQDKAKEIITQMKEVGIYRIGFKPGSLSGIESVIEIAKENKDVSILVEWTGGRSGGHHSLEDQHQPLIKMYNKLREHDNIILILGGGIGDIQQSWKYLSGEWIFDYSLSNLSQKMPFDGILLASRVMVAKECLTDDKVKQKITTTEGTGNNELEWSKSLTEKGVNGIRSIKSEFNENLHVIDNKLARCWKYFDDNYFLKFKSSEELEKNLNLNKSYVIQRINEDNCKLYFPVCRETNQPLNDLTEMDYLHVTERLFNFSIVGGNIYDSNYQYNPSPTTGEPVPWFDVSYGERWKQWVKRVIERCNITELGSGAIHERDFLDNPYTILSMLKESKNQENLKYFLSPEDKLYFLELSKKVYWKPANYIPVIDKEFNYWLKKDTLWYSEDFRGVPFQDAERVLILQGPVAVTYSHSVNQPMKSLLDEFNDGILQCVKKQPHPNPLTSISYQLPSISSSVPSLDFHAFSEFLVENNVNINESHYEWIKLLKLSKILDSNGLWKENPMIYYLNNPNYKFDFLQRSSPEAQGSHKSIIEVRDKKSNQLKLTIEKNEKKQDEVTVTLNHYYELSEINTNPLANHPINQSDLIMKYKIQPSTSIYSEDIDFVLMEEEYSSIIDASNSFYADIWRVATNKAASTSTTSTTTTTLNGDDNLIGWNFTSEVETVTNEHTQSFLLTIGEHLPNWSLESNHSERTGEYFSPLDFSFVVAWPSFAAAMLKGLGISDSMLKGVHLQHRYDIVKSRTFVHPRTGEKKYYFSKPNEQFYSTARITARYNKNNGRIVTCYIEVFLVKDNGQQNELLVTITSTCWLPNTTSLVHLFNQNNYNHLFNFNDAPFELKSMFLSKKWHNLTQDSIEKESSGVLRFEYANCISFNNKLNAEDVAYAGSGSVLTTGKIYDHYTNQHLGDVLLTSENCTECLVSSFFHRNTPSSKGSIQLLSKRTSTNGHLINAFPFNESLFENKNNNELILIGKINNPSSMGEYSKYSRDVNPIHTNFEFARIVGFPEPIVHGMFTNSQIRRIMNESLSEYNIESFTTNFQAPVMLQEKLFVYLQRGGIENGKEFDKIIVKNKEELTVCYSDVVISKKLATGYMYTGQGSAFKGMGMELYNGANTFPNGLPIKSNEIDLAKRIWNEVDEFYRNNYGFSLVYIVSENPKSIRISYKGKHGQRIKNNWKNSYPRIKNDNVDHSIVENENGFTLLSPNGILFRTEFQQASVVVYQYVEKERLKLNGQYDYINEYENNIIVCGHSLGEFSAFSSLLNENLFSIQLLSELVFKRGLIMQSVVERDDQSESPYRMVAVSLLKKNYSFLHLQSLIQFIQSVPDEQGTPPLIQIVNYNANKEQYVITGNKEALEMLSSMLDKNLSPDGIKNPTEYLLQSKSNLKNRGGELNRNDSCIPLKDIDIPFHSKVFTSQIPLLRSAIIHFFNELREISFKKNLKLSIKPLVNKFIPNVTGNCLFSCDGEFVDALYNKTASEKVAHVQQTLASLNNSGKRLKDLPESEYENALLDLLIESLSYQIALPVQWINTQDLLLHSLKLSNIIEIGPNPVLVPLLKRVYLKDSVMAHSHPFGYEYRIQWSNDKPSILSSPNPKSSPPPPSSPPSNTSSVPSKQAPPPPPAASSKATAPPATTTTTTPGAPATLPPPAPVVRSAGGKAGSITIEARSVHLLRVLMSHKLKQPIEKVSTDKTIRELCGGRSALQNEIMAEIQKEFTVTGDGLEQASLSGAAEKLKINSPTPFQNMVDTAIAKVLPSGTNRQTINAYYSNEWGIASSSIPILITHASTPGLCPNDPFKDEGSLYKWLDDVVSHYSTVNGLPLPSKSSSSASGSQDSQSVQVVAAIDPKQFESLKKLFEKQKQAISQFLEDSKGNEKAENTSSKQDAAVSDIQLETIIKEHGIHYLKGLASQFDVNKIRVYDSWIQWGKVELIELLSSDLFTNFQSCNLPEYNDSSLLSDLNWNGKESDKDVLSIKQKIHSIVNRSSKSQEKILLNYLERQKLSEHPLGKLLKVLIRNSLKSMKGRQTRKEERGLYKENNVPQKPSLHEDGSFYETVRYEYKGKDDDMTYKSYVKDMTDPNHFYRFHVSPALGGGEEVTKEVNEIYKTSLLEYVNEGHSFSGCTALLVGAGPGSIASFIARNLLLGGCNVIIANAFVTKEVYAFFQKLYQDYGAKGSKLTIVPFNGVARHDVQQLVDLLWKAKSQGGLECGAPDFIIPFVALPEQSTTISQIDDQSELAHRAMVTNINRLVGLIGDKVNGEKGAGKYHLGSSQSTVILPLSPNHGIFGYDGLYAESKLSLRSLFMKCQSEPWGKSVSVIGAEIGWTRSTNLMSNHDSVSFIIENQLNMKTFSQVDMAFNILGLLHPSFLEYTQSQGPFVANLTGGFKSINGTVTNIPLSDIRRQSMTEVVKKQAIAKDNQIDASLLNASSTATTNSTNSNNNNNAPLSYNERCLLQKQLKFPKLEKSKPSMKKELEGLIDLSQVVVCVGFGEIGPYGNHRTRWEWERYNQFSKEGAIELARSIGLIEFQKANQLGKDQYIGWIDSTSKKAIDESKILEIYKDELNKHTGIRYIDPSDTPHGYDPKSKVTLKQVVIEEDMPPFEITSKNDLEDLKKRHGDYFEAIDKGNGQLFGRLKKGASIYVSKAREFDRQVAGMLPLAWNATLSYGIPDDIVNSVDPITVYSLCATMDALTTAGIKDPYELYEYVHVSEVGSSFGSGMGGGWAFRKSFRDRFTGERTVESDILQESFINTPAAWINMLLMSSSGPIKPQVAACATAASSVDSAVDCILRGKAKVMLAGGVETFSEEGSFEFAQMNATSSSKHESEIGYDDPKQHCRPTSSTRGGFMEGKGCGVQLLMSADIAVRMGLPIYSIIAYTNTSTDKQGRSVPAPGQGLLSNYRDASISLPQVQGGEDGEGREGRVTTSSTKVNETALLSLEYRKQQFKNIISTFPLADNKLLIKNAQKLWGHEYYLNDATISPMKGALSVWGLTADEIDIVSFHGTGTKANDPNEISMLHKALLHLGRTAGHPVYSIFQKWFTGHSKGAAAAWMLNGLMQSMNDEIVPGNRNADNIDPIMNDYDLVLLSNKNIHLKATPNAGLIQSFGFGQAGAQVLIVHPNYLYSSMDVDTYNSYSSRRSNRYNTILNHWLSHIYNNHILVEIKNQTPYPEKSTQTVYLNSLARTGFWNPLNFSKLTFQPSSSSSSSSSSSQKIGFGIDIENHSTFTNQSGSKDNFINTNFTQNEISEASSSVRATESFTGKWCAKEAVVKAFCSLDHQSSSLYGIGSNASASLLDIEISSKNGPPVVRLSGKMKSLADNLGLSSNNIHLSITHASDFSCAQCVIVL